MCIIILAGCDTAASFYGRKYGHLTPRLPQPIFGRSKSLAGSMGAAGVGTVSAWLFWTFAVRHGPQDWLAVIPSDTGVPVWALSIFSGVTAGVVEALNLGGLDDNLTLPILWGGCVWAGIRAVGVVSK